MGFSRQDYWSGLQCPSPGDLPNPGIEPSSPSLQADSLPSEPPGKPIVPVQSGSRNCFLHSIFILFRSWTGWGWPPLRGQKSWLTLFSLPIQMLILSRNTLTDTSRIYLTKCLSPPWSLPLITLPLYSACWNLRTFAGHSEQWKAFKKRGNLIRLSGNHLRRNPGSSMESEWLWGREGEAGCSVMEQIRSLLYRTQWWGPALPYSNDPCSIAM